MFSEVLPLRAILFQVLFLLIAIAIEAFVFHRRLNPDYKTSMQYAASINLFSTFVGWLIFFNSQPFLPPEWRIQLISFIFFERFYSDPLFVSVSPVLISFALAMFFGTFLLKLKGLDFLDYLFEKAPPKKEEVAEPRPRYRSRENQLLRFRSNSRVYTVLVANACSFSAILFLLFFRLVEQTYFPK